MKQNRRNFLVNLILFLGSAIIVSALYFDAWWHVNIGRESLFTIPHIFLYLGIALVVVGSKLKLNFKIIRNKRPERLLFVSILVLVSFLLIDNYWHEIFGVEDPKSLEAIWSPPHILGTFSGVLGFFAIFQIFLLDKKKIMNKIPLVLEFQYASFVGMVLIILGPLDPTYIFKVFFPFGVIALSFVSSFLYVFGSAKIGRDFALTKISLFNWALAIFIKPLASVLVYPVSAFISETLTKNSKLDFAKKSFLRVVMTTIIFSFVYFPLTEFLLDLRWTNEELVYVIFSSLVAGISGAFLGYNIVKTKFSRNFL